MAVYKVIQDVEAEDKLLGPLTLKGFIYAAIAGVSAFLEFRLLVAGSLGDVRWFLMLAFLGPMILFGVLASPLGREQPTEVWLLSRIRFFFKPRVRLWNQSGMNHLVTITAPKRIEHQLTKNLSQAEVHSRLQALANTLDSHGWATKNVNLNDGAATGYLADDDGGSDRLVGTSSLGQNASVIDVHAADDILDEQNNATAQNFAALMQQADNDRKKAIADKIDAARNDSTAVQPSMDSTFLDQTATGSTGGATTFVGRNVLAPTAQDDNTPSGQASMTETEKQLLDRLHREEAELKSKLPKHLRSDSALMTKPEPTPMPAPTPVQPPTNPPPPAQVTPEVEAAKMELAQSGNDLSVASIAHLANRKNQMQQIGPNEFVIALH